jgi:hypothetical protein
MHVILERLQGNKAPFNSHQDRFGSTTERSATQLLGPGAYFNPDESTFIKPRKDSSLKVLTERRSKSVMKKLGN